MEQDQVSPQVAAAIAGMAGRAKQGAKRLALANRAEKDQLLNSLADALESHAEEILQANQQDVTGRTQVE